MNKPALAMRLAPLCPDLDWAPEQEADTVFLRDLYASTRWQEMAQVPWTDEAKRAFLHEQFQLQRDHYRKNYIGAEFLVVRQHGQPTGRMYLFASPREIRLMDIALIESKRGIGLGRKLVEALMTVAREDDAEITLHVETNNSALHLYERLGFRLIENRGVYHFLGWKPPDAAA